MRSWPWDSIVTGMGDNGYPIYDRAYDASDLREVWSAFFSNGVFLIDEGSFQVTAGEGMTVNVAPGKCLIEGTFGYEPSVRQLALQAASSQPRIDTVVLRWNLNREVRAIDLYVRSGVASATPVRPELARNETVWELGLADVYVAASTTTLTAQRITDTRLETDRCGAVEPFSKIDTTTFYEQLQAAVDYMLEFADSALNGTLAGHLQKEVEDHAARLEVVELATRGGSLTEGWHYTTAEVTNTTGGTWSFTLGNNGDRLFTISGCVHAQGGGSHKEQWNLMEIPGTEGRYGVRLNRRLTTGYSEKIDGEWVYRDGYPAIYPGAGFINAVPYTSWSDYLNIGMLDLVLALDGYLWLSIGAVANAAWPPANNMSYHMVFFPTPLVIPEGSILRF